MPRSIFGWDLPPGCSHRDVERAMGGDARDPSDLEETIWDLVEKAGLPIEVNEAVAKVFDDYFASLMPPEPLCSCGIEPHTFAGEHHAPECPMFFNSREM